MTEMAVEGARAGNLARIDLADLWIRNRVATLPA